MTRKGLISIICGLLCLLQVGCDNSYEGLHGVSLDTNHVENQRILMFVGKSNDISRGTGVVNNVEGFAGRPFYVYSFIKGSLDAHYGETSSQNPTGCLIDASIDKAGSIQGRKVYWEPSTGLVEWSARNAPVMYYPVGEALGFNYDFFAYYVDDMKIEEKDVHRLKNSVVVDIEIDGSQDIMSSFAKPKETDLFNGLDKFDEAYAYREYSYRKECSFSWYTAQLNIHPTFIFKHHLVKLDFKLVPGHTPGIAKDLKVEKIEVYSRNKGQFTVAHKNASNIGIRFDGEPVSLELKEADGSTYRPRTVSTVSSANYGSAKVIDDMGSLLVAPGMDYYIELTVTETRDGEVVSESVRGRHHLYLGKTPGYDEGDADREDGGVFTAGGEYQVTLTMFGSMDVNVSTDLTDWQPGGNWTHDDDMLWDD